jgi:hypothetical protein
LDDLETNKRKYSLVDAGRKSSKFVFDYSRYDDQAVKMEESFNLLRNILVKQKSHVILDANHVFGGSTPYSGTELLRAYQELVSDQRVFL